MMLPATSARNLPAACFPPKKRFARIRPGILLAAVLCLGLFSPVVFGSSVTEDQSAAAGVRLYPDPVVNGNVLLLLIDSHAFEHPIVGIQARYDGHIIPVFDHPLAPTGMYIGLVGISYYSRPGSTRIKLEWTDETGYHHRRLSFSIVQGRYRSEKLRVPARKVVPLKGDMQRINREKAAVKDIYALSQARHLWQAPFQLPVDGKITSPYGSRRTYNGQTKRYHSGIDFRAAVGTPIKSANTGIVRMAEDLFFAGKHVIVDHGKGLFTSYSHLSEFRVSPGQLIDRGTVVGLAGASGRANGPHLHWGAKLNGVNINPMQLLDISNIVLQPGAAPDPVTARRDDASPSE